MMRPRNTRQVPLRPQRPSSAQQARSDMMRALIVLVGLVATPFLAGVSQQVKTNSGVGHDDAHCGMRYSLHPSATDINKCPPPTPTGGRGGTGGTTGGDTGGTTGGTTGGSTGGSTGGTTGG